LIIAVVATVENIAQPSPASARKPRNPAKLDIVTLARSMSAIKRRPKIMSGRPRRRSRYPVGRLATHLPAPKTTGINVTMR